MCQSTTREHSPPDSLVPVGTWVPSHIQHIYDLRLSFKTFIEIVSCEPRLRRYMCGQNSSSNGSTSAFFCQKGYQYCGSWVSSGPIFSIPRPKPLCCLSSTNTFTKEIQPLKAAHICTKQKQDNISKPYLKINPNSLQRYTHQFLNIKKKKADQS